MHRCMDRSVVCWRHDPVSMRDQPSILIERHTQPAVHVPSSTLPCCMKKARCRSFRLSFGMGGSRSGLTCPQIILLWLANLTSNSTVGTPPESQVYYTNSCSTHKLAKWLKTTSILRADAAGGAGRLQECSHSAGVAASGSPKAEAPPLLAGLRLHLSSWGSPCLRSRHRLPDPPQVRCRLPGGLGASL